MLTQLQITAAKPNTKPYTLSDGYGLALFVQPSGAKLWRFRYRYGGQARTLHIGQWPALSLADAREKCREARRAIASGIDPVLEKKRAKIESRLRFRWEERDGPEVTPPTQTGFGSKLIQRVLASEIDGTVTLEYPATGVVFEASAPLPDGEE